MSMPELRIQSGMATQIRARGSPEENDRRVTDAVRQDAKAVARLRSAPGPRGGTDLSAGMDGDDTGWASCRPPPVCIGTTDMGNRP
jgi:hypothetical protein